MAQPTQADTPQSATALTLTTGEAWDICAAALRTAIPALGEPIEMIARGAPKCLAPDPAKHPVPFTYDLGAGELPFISLHYQARPADLLAMVHEFGHAVQIVASAATDGVRMPAVARECCAFLAERALLFHCAGALPALETAYLRDDAVYFGPARSMLTRAARDSKMPYQYEWNYPVARYIAALVSGPAHWQDASALFTAGAQGGRLLQDMIDAKTVRGKAA